MGKFGQYIPLTVGVLDRIVRPRISRVTIPITYDCNQKCKTCGIWKINKENPSLRDKEMTLEEFSKFLKINKLLWVAITGGEPYLKPGIHLFLQEAMKGCSLVGVTTNGFNGERLQRVTWGCLGAVKSNSVLAVNVSFEGPEALHDEIAGVKGSYQGALSTYRRLFQTSKGDRRLKVGISYTTSYFNQGRFGEFKEGLGREFPGYGGFHYGIAQGALFYNWGKYRRVIPDYIEVKKFVEEVRSNYPSRLNPFSWVSDKYLDGLVNGRRPKCVAGQYSVMLDPYWNVYPCMFMCPTNPIGNLRELGFDLKKIDYEESRELVNGCESPCWTPCEAYPTIAFRPWRVL